MEKGQPFQQMFLRQPDTHMPKNYAKSNLTLFTKINTEWIKKLNVRAKTIHHAFLGMTPKAQISKEKKRVNWT